MARWLSKVAEAIAGSPEREAVIRALQGVSQQRARILLEQPPPAGATEPLRLTTIIEQVRTDDFVVAVPMHGNYARQLTTGETVTMALDSDAGRMSSPTQCLGRIKLPSGGQEAFFGYRMSLPERLETINRGHQPLLPLGFEMVPDVELHTRRSADASPVRGLVDDLHVSGMTIRSRNAADRLTPGERAYLKAVLPEPIGALDEMVIVSEIAPGRTDDELVIMVEFEQQVERLEALVRAATGRASQRRIGL